MSILWDIMKFIRNLVVKGDNKAHYKSPLKDARATETELKKAKPPKIRGIGPRKFVENT